MASTRPILLMTRPKTASEGFVALLHDHGMRDCDVVVSPLLGIQPAGALPVLDGQEILAFTSAHGVAAYLSLGGKPGAKAYAVGQATAEAARRAGLEVTVCGGDADALVADILAQDPEGEVIHLRGSHGRGNVAARLRAQGILADEAVIYDQPAQPLTDSARSALSGTRPVVAPLFSPRSGALMARARGQTKAPLLVAAMSEAVAKEVAPLHSHAVRVAERPDADSMSVCVLDLLAEARHLEPEQRGL